MRKMPGIPGDDEEQPASRSAGGKLVRVLDTSLPNQDLQRRMMAIAIKIMRT